MSTGNWDDIIKKAEAERFVGRGQELDIFRRQIALDPPDFLVFYITGLGGVGKTTLLNRYREIAKNYPKKDAGFLLADCSEQQRDVPAVLGRFARQLAEQKVPLKRFDKQYKIYRQRKQEIENDPEAPQGLADQLGKGIVRFSFLLADTIPGVRKAAEYLPSEPIETRVSEWVKYLAKKLTKKEEIDLMCEPGPILTPLFFEDLNLNPIVQKQRVLLCFDDFEVTRQDLQDWLLHLPEYKPSQNIRIAIAGRELLGRQWDSLRPVTMVIDLDVFTEREAEEFLDTYRISDIKRRREILEGSGRLPVFMSWLAAPQGSDPDPSIPTDDIVERFLRWVTDPTWRFVALAAAIPRTFNVDILKPLLDHEQQSIDVQSAFKWLKAMPFVQERPDGWHYHPVVRQMMLRYRRQENPRTYRQMQAILADYYNKSRVELPFANGEEWANEQWRKETLAYAYHFLAADPTKHWTDIVSLFVLALRWHRDFATDIIELLLNDDVHDELTQEQNALVGLLHEQLQAVKDGSLHDGFKMFDQLCTMINLSPQAKGYAFAYRGECYRTDRKWENALLDFERALHYIADDAWALASRGEMYRWMERYEEAIADFDRAIALDEKSAWALASRGETYLLMGRYEEALADFDRAIASFKGMLNFEEVVSKDRASAESADQQIQNDDIAGLFYTGGTTGRPKGVMLSHKNMVSNLVITLDDEIVWAMVGRALAYRGIGAYEEALAYFDRAITLDEKSAWIIASRGLTYRLMEHYEEAIADFTQAIILNEKSAWIIASRGQAYRRMGKYEEAIADFDQAIALDEKYAWALASRGEMYRWMERYKEALADIDRAIALDEKSDWFRYCRAQIDFLTHQTNVLESDLNSAVELAQLANERSLNRGDRWRFAFNQALYYLFWMKQEEAQKLYDRLIETCMLLPRLQVAAMDLKELQSIQPHNEQAQHIYAQLQDRIAEVKQILL